jgi:hypothetical protein
LHLQGTLAFGDALDPPEQVVQRMLELNVDAAASGAECAWKTRTRANLMVPRRFRRGRKMAQTQNKPTMPNIPRLGRPPKNQASLVLLWNGVCNAEVPSSIARRG